ncbi:MAG: glycosyltransferase family 4 protein [Candidatus Latescibacteria bacterium]|jgi:glycosyltransferase involved in cell wall biosynthesis|nr:glycosyltransferase family 4 protein [Candidatus Latescibacterota bacterium]
MRIAYIAAGAAGMYCGSCIHDNALASAFQRKGIDFALIPTYTPLRSDEPGASIDQIFYGGINVYLQQKIGLFRHTPWFIDRLFNNRTLLNSLARFSGSTRAEDLGALTVSVLQGENGPQKKELAKLVQWLKKDYQPNLVQLTNSMFLGMAREIKRELDVPVLCSLQGEDIFLEGLIEPYKSDARQLLQERAKDVDGFVATCDYYANFMAEYLNISRTRIHVVRLGIKLDGHGENDSNLEPAPFTIGYLARICPEKGLHVLADAFHQLAEQVGKEKVELKVAGYLSKRDEAYFQQICEQIETWDLTDRFDYWGEVDRKEKITFLNSIHTMSIPTPYKEPKGLSLLEAMANGVPVVQPRHGTFPEIIEQTGGGILVEPDSSEALASGLLRIMNDVEGRKELGKQGKEAVHQNFSDEKMADATLDVYRRYVVS